MLVWSFFNMLESQYWEGLVLLAVSLSERFYLKTVCFAQYGLQSAAGQMVKATVALYICPPP